MRKLVVGVLFGFLAAATAAWALEVTFPTRSKAQARVIVDELGNVLFGAMPAKVEVTNLPSGCGTVETASAVVDQITGSAVSANVLTVPAGKRFILTDYTIADSNTSEPLVLSDSGGARLIVSGVGSSRFESGVSFGPGETIVLTRSNGMTPQFRGTFMGRLEPVS